MAKQHPRRSPRSDPSAVASCLQRATQYHQAGQWQAAEHLYRQVLQQQPAHIDALHFLGVIALQTGRYQEAIAHCEAVLARKPDLVYAHIHLAHALRATAQWDRAIAHYQTALAQKPDLPDVHLSLGTVFYERGQVAAAIAQYQQALHWRPTLAAAHYNLGRVFQEQRQTAAAILHYRQAIALAPQLVEALSNLGTLLLQQQQIEEAIHAYQQAIQLQPQHPGLYINLGKAMEASGQHQAAIACYEHALQVQPTFAEAHNNLGDRYRDQNQMAIAITHYRKAIALQPDLAEAHSNLGMALLRMGDYEMGFREYEWRWRCAKAPPVPPPVCCWNGEDLTDKTILLISEQGYGDAIQFIRYVPLIRKTAKRVILQCAPPLIRLFTGMAELDEVVADTAPLPPFDVYIALGSLPHRLETTLATIPGQLPYLPLPPIQNSELEQRLGERSPETLNLGLVWAGKPQYSQDPARNRTCPLHHFAPLLGLPGLTFYSLQVGSPVQEINALGWQETIRDLSPYLHDFADTAWAIAQLDLVISVDTAVAHLAGALGQTVWVLLPFAAEWRWLLHRSDSPWYPTLRLIRQSHPGDWDGVIQQVIGQTGE